MVVAAWDDSLGRGPCSWRDFGWFRVGDGDVRFRLHDVALVVWHVGVVGDGVVCGAFTFLGEAQRVNGDSCRVASSGCIVRE